MFDTHPQGCPAGALSTEELFHAAIAYRRAPGNADPDADPQTAEAQQIRSAVPDAPAIVGGLK